MLIRHNNRRMSDQSGLLPVHKRAENSCSALETERCSLIGQEHRAGGGVSARYLPKQYRSRDLPMENVKNCKMENK